MVGQVGDEPTEEYLSRVEAHLREVAGETSAASALSYARTLTTSGLPPLFDVAHLTHVCGVRWYRFRQMLQSPENEYTSFRLPKRGGGSRLIYAPSPELKHVQRWIARHVFAHLPHHDNVHGFRSGRTIVTNAQPHVGSPWILRFDITDFFGTTSAERARAVIHRLGYHEQLVGAFVRLTTLNGSLPQGAPTSPALANAVAAPLDNRLSGAAAAFDARYTRYADDITMSGSGGETQALRRLVDKIIRDAGYSPNLDKIKLIPQSGQQRVTGLVVNGDRPSFPRQRRRWLRQEVYYLRRFGGAVHLARRGYVRTNYRDWIYGHVCALMLVHRKEAQALLEQLDGVEWHA